MIPLVTLTIALGLTQAPTQAGESEPLATVIYDVRAVGPDLTAEQSWMPMLPFLSVSDEWDVDLDEVRDHVHSLLWHLWSDEFEYEGRQLDDLDRGRLLVTAPEDVHASIGRLLRFLRASFQRRATVDWTLFALPDPGRLPDSVDVEQIPGLVGEGLLVPLQRRREQLVVGQSHFRRSHDVRRLVRGWDGEIAQTSAMATPEIRALTTGITLGLRAESADTGAAVRLRFVQGLADLRQLDSRSVGLTTRLTLQNSSDQLTREALVDLSTVAWSLTSGSGLLRPGESLLTLGAVQTHAGSVAYAVQFTLIELAPLPEPLLVDDVAVTILDGSSLYWQSLDPPVVSAAQLRGGGDDGEMDGYTHVDFEPIAFPSRDIDEENPGWRVVERLEREASDVHWSTLGHWTLLASDPAAVSWAARSFSRQLAPLRPLVLELGLSPVGLETDAVVRCRLPLEAGGSGMAMLGDAISMIDGYEVDVATGAVISSPRVVDVFDGVYVRATAELTGSVVVDLVSHRLAALEFVDLRNLVADSFHRPRFTSAELRSRVPADGQRHELAILGSALDGSDALQLWARVHSGRGDVR